jgi:hypothetical protein
MKEAETLLRQDLPPLIADANLAWLAAQLPQTEQTAQAPDTTSRNWSSLK